MTKETIQDSFEQAQVIEPFDLATALSHMNTHGEFIRCVKGDLDFYFYKITEQRPIWVEGRRQWVSIDTMKTSTQWQGAVPQLDISLLNEKCFYLMRFTETGEPIWERLDTAVEVR